ncbi:MAG: TonB family protein [Pseudomonadota bacterium]|nr:TonB family protein [Pseudomonadota bacterium]
MTEAWTKEWERRTVNGAYPLLRFLGRSNHSVVFLTECKAQNVAEAAIKILPDDPALTQAQLSQWRRVASLSHPHLIRLFDAGCCQLGGHKFLFVVMDLAEQNLAQVLPGRALTCDEVRDMLPPALDALAYLHAKNLVQGGLKPPNFLVVNDHLKLASDTIRPAGEPPATIAKLTLYDPPEARIGKISTAGDIWGLGITLVEALTQAPPAWSRDTLDTVALPANLAQEFMGTVQRCLQRDPGHRPAIAELAAQFKRSAPTAPDSAAPAVVNEPLVATPSKGQSSKKPLLVTAIMLGVLTLWAVWAGLFHTHLAVRKPASIIPLPPPAVLPLAPAEHPNVSVSGLPTVLQQEMPDISRSARQSIRGVIKVVVRVTVDGSGNVVGAIADHRSSSKYFVRAATKAAQQWKFAPAADQVSRVWLLQFEFTRAGAAAHAAAMR